MIWANGREESAQVEVVRHFIYADNITVIVGTKLIEIMERVTKTSKETSLYRNVLNTKVNTTGDIEDVTLGGKMVDVVTIFIFLGALIIRDGLASLHCSSSNSSTSFSLAHSTTSSANIICQCFFRSVNPS